MYRTYRLTEKEKESNFIISNCNGDCTFYTVCKNESEFLQEKEKIAKINREYKQAIKDYLNS